MDKFTIGFWTLLNSEGLGFFVAFVFMAAIFGGLLYPLFRSIGKTKGE